MIWAAAAAAGGALMNVGANVIGMAQSAGDRAAAIGAFQDAVRHIQEVGAPPDLAREIILEKFQQAGVLNPAMEQEINVGMSKVADIHGSEQAKQAQLNALNIISQRAAGGLTPEDRQALDDAKQQVEQQAQGQQQQIMQEMQQRGMGGAGQELAQRLIASQAATGRLANAGSDVAAQASRNALQAAMQSGQLGGQIEQQTFGEAQTKASAEDVMNQFKAQLAAAQQQRNVAAQNQAQASNIGRQQQVSDANVAAQNQEYQRQKQAEQQVYEDKLYKAGMLAGVTQQLGSAYGKKAEQTAQGWSNIGKGFSEMGSGFGNILGGGGKG